MGWFLYDKVLRHEKAKSLATDVSFRFKGSLRLIIKIFPALFKSQSSKVCKNMCTGENRVLENEKCKKNLVGKKSAYDLFRLISQLLI